MVFEDLQKQSTRDSERYHLQTSLTLALLLLLPLWTVKVIELRLADSFIDWGLFPRSLEGLMGIITMPFLHGDLDHLYHNSFGVGLLGMGLFLVYPRVAWRVLGLSSLACGCLVWLFGRESYHIGASGVVYALIFFLFISGVVRRYDRPAKGMALIVSMLYGGAIWGIFPLYKGVSWEGHLFGAVAGFYLAMLYRDVNLPVLLPEEDQEEEPLPAPWPRDEAGNVIPFWDMDAMRQRQIATQRTEEEGDIDER